MVRLFRIHTAACRFLGLGAVSVLALAACSEGATGPGAAGDAEPGVEIGTLTADDIRGTDLPGELACAFDIDDTPQPVMLVRANVMDEEFSEGVIKVDGRIEPVRSQTPGGFNALLDGETLAGGGMTVDVIVTGEPETAGEESPPMPARLVYVGDTGARMVVEGEWRCGP
ncbi:MAG: hypothetical protein VX529_02425 [Pseudomonadota bacterium]|nr:hypothetical protein [Pseudomonadota bacterium]